MSSQKVVSLGRALKVGEVVSGKFSQATKPEKPRSLPMTVPKTKAGSGTVNNPKKGKDAKTTTKATTTTTSSRKKKRSDNDNGDDERYDDDEDESIGEAVSVTPITPTKPTVVAGGGGKKRESLVKVQKKLTSDDFDLVCMAVEGMCTPLKPKDDVTKATFENFYPAFKRDGTAVYVLRIVGDDTESYRMVEYQTLRKYMTGRDQGMFPESGFDPDRNVHVYHDGVRGKIDFVYWTDYFIQRRNEDSIKRRSKLRKASELKSSPPPPPPSSTPTAKNRKGRSSSKTTPKDEDVVDDDNDEMLKENDGEEDEEGFPLVKKAKSAEPLATKTKKSATTKKTPSKKKKEKELKDPTIVLEIGGPDRTDVRLYPRLANTKVVPVGQPTDKFSLRRWATIYNAYPKLQGEVESIVKKSGLEKFSFVVQHLDREYDSKEIETLLSSFCGMVKKPRMLPSNRKDPSRYSTVPFPTVDDREVVETFIVSVLTKRIETDSK